MQWWWKNDCEIVKCLRSWETFMISRNVLEFKKLTKLNVGEFENWFLTKDIHQFQKYSRIWKVAGAFHLFFFEFFSAFFTIFERWKTWDEKNKKKGNKKPEQTKKQRTEKECGLGKFWKGRRKFPTNRKRECLAIYLGQPIICP